MLDPENLKDLQARAVIREWQDAYNDGNLVLAVRIAQANPDLFDGKGTPKA